METTFESIVSFFKDIVLKRPIFIISIIGLVLSLIITDNEIILYQWLGNILSNLFFILSALYLFKNPNYNKKVRKEKFLKVAEPVLLLITEILFLMLILKEHDFCKSFISIIVIVFTAIVLIKIYKRAIYNSSKIKILLFCTVITIISLIFVYWINEGCYDMFNYNINNISILKINLKNKNFNKAKFDNISFKNCIFKNCQFIGTEIINSNFDSCCFIKSYFNKSHFKENNELLTGSSFVKALFYRTDFSESTLESTNLNNCVFKDSCNFYMTRFSTIFAKNCNMYEIINLDNNEVFNLYDEHIFNTTYPKYTEDLILKIIKVKPFYCYLFKGNPDYKDYVKQYCKNNSFNK